MKVIQLELSSTELKLEQSASNFIPIYNYGLDNTSEALESPKCVLEQVKEETLRSAPEQAKQEILEFAPEQKHLENQLELSKTEVKFEESVSNLIPIHNYGLNNTSESLESPKCVLEQVKEETLTFAPEQNKLKNHWVEEYFPSNRKNYKYFRYVWMSERKINHVHIRGGNINAPLARSRKQYIEEEILNGSSPDKILQIIKNEFK